MLNEVRIDRWMNGKLTLHSEKERCESLSSAGVTTLTTVLLPFAQSYNRLTTHCLNLGYEFRAVTSLTARFLRCKL